MSVTSTALHWGTLYGHPIPLDEARTINLNVTSLWGLLDIWDRHIKGACSDYCEYCTKDKGIN